MDDINISILTAPLSDLFSEGKYLETMVGLRKIWESLPEPKIGVENSHLIVEYGVLTLIKMNCLDEAATWAERGLLFKDTIFLAGEAEFMCGEVAFLKGDLSAARNFFKRVKLLSGKRLFKGKDPRYLELLGHKDNRR